MPSVGKYRHQDVTMPPAGYKVRTIHAGKHLVRIAFPKGARKKGSGQLVSILHPKKEKNPECGGTLQLASAEIASLAIPLEVTGNGFGRGFEGALGSTAVENPTDWREYWDKFKGKISELIQKAKDPSRRGAEAQRKRNYTEEVHTSDGKTVFVDVLGSGEKWMAEGYPIISGKIRRVAKPKIARGRTEDEAYDNLIAMLERNPGDFKRVSGVEVPRDKFAYVGDPKLKATWKLPLDVYGRIKDALSRFKHTRLPKDVRRSVAERIAREARAVGIDPNGFEAKYLKNPCKAKKNLDEIDAAVELAGKFKGAPAESLREQEVPFKHRDDFGHLAWLYELVFHPAFDRVHLVPKEVAKIFHDIYENDESVKNSQQAWEKTAKQFNTVFLVFDFSGDEIELVSTAKGEQLELIGGNQASFPQHFTAFRIRQKHDRDDLGDLVGITYLAKKEQFNDQKEKPYYHVFGEDGGEFPRAYFDQLNKRIVLSGGSYHLNEAEKGIIN